MKSYFRKLAKPWRDAIDRAIADVDGNERPDVAGAYREIEAESLLSFRLAAKPGKGDIKDFSEAYINFAEGWRAILKDVEEKWDSLYRHAVWEGLPDAEAMRQFDQYIQKLTLPQRLNEKFPPKVETR